MQAAEQVGRIGPNAITRVETALRERLGEGPRLEVFARAGLLRHLATPPTEMVPEADVTRLHAAMQSVLSADEAAAVATEAGRQTAAYLLAHRIPRFAQLLLRMLPANIASQLFTRAIADHAWTFTGSGRFSAMRDAGGLILLITDNPAVRGVSARRPSCHYFAATFEGLYRAILGPDVQVRETGCEAAGAQACTFRVTWSGTPHTPDGH